MVTDIISHNHLLKLAKLAHLHENFLIKALEVFDSLNKVLFGDITTVSESNSCVRILIHVFETHRLRERWLIMDTGASVTVPACTNFEIEWTVYSKQRQMNIKSHI